MHKIQRPHVVDARIVVVTIEDVGSPHKWATAILIAEAAAEAVYYLSSAARRPWRWCPLFLVNTWGTTHGRTRTCFATYGGGTNAVPQGQRGTFPKINKGDGAAGARAAQIDTAPVDGTVQAKVPAPVTTRRSVTSQVPEPEGFVRGRYSGAGCRVDTRGSGAAG